MSEKKEAINEIKLEIEQIAKKVEQLETGGDLDELLNKEIDKIKEKIYGNMTSYRSEKQAQKGSFPPSDALSEMRQTTKILQSGKKKKKDN